MRLREISDHIFWHGSDVPKLTELKPEYSALVGKHAVFVATYPEIAVAMSGHWADKDFRFGRSLKKNDDPNEVPYTMKELREGAFEEFFSDPVFLYEVDGKGFHEDPNIQDFELISSKLAKIVEEHKIDEPLEYLHKSKMVKLVALDLKY